MQQRTNIAFCGVLHATELKALLLPERLGQGVTQHVRRQGRGLVELVLGEYNLLTNINSNCNVISITKGLKQEIMYYIYQSLCFL